MAPQVVLPRDFDIKNVSFSDVKNLDNGGKIIYVSYNRAPFFFQTPTMSAPFGMSSWDGGEGKGAVKYSLDLSFKDMESTPSIRAFFDALSLLDKKLVDDGFANQSTWFKGKKYGSRDIVEALYTPLVKYAKDKVTGEKTDAYPPTFKATVPYRDGSFACDVFGGDRKPVDLGEIETKGSRVTGIVQCTGVWFAGGKFGVSWRIAQMKVVASSNKLSGFALRDDEDPRERSTKKKDVDADGDGDEDADLAAEAAKASAATCIVSSSDDSEDDNDL